MARLNTDGSLDTTFTQTGSGLNSNTFSVKVQDDGQILVAGVFTAYNGAARRCIAMLNADGSLDTGFTQVGAGVNAQIIDTETQIDGKIIIAGVFTNYSGTVRKYIARLNSDGSLDATFAPTGSGFDNTITRVKLLADQDMIVSGYFTTYNGAAKPYIARLNPDGSLDTTFNIGTGTNQWVMDIDTWNDSKILVTGSFSYYNSTPVPRLMRLNYDGTLDETFLDNSSGPSSGGTAITAQPDGKVLVGGSFKSVNTSLSYYLTHLTYEGEID